MTPHAFRESHPDLFFLDSSNPAELEQYLKDRSLLPANEFILRLEKAGDGNMNCTLRFATAKRSLIVKQARPWVEKYPQFAAPWDRTLQESEFYRLVSQVPGLSEYMPRLIHADSKARLLVLEDLGEGGDFTGIYRGETLAATTIQQLASFLSMLHGAFLDRSPMPTLPNREMRALNHAHIFAIPLQREIPLNLDAIQPGLQSAANQLKDSTEFCSEVARLGREFYLADGRCLIHGDFFPGSLVRTANGPRVIDPEFGFFGHAEFDVGVLLAHLFLGAQSLELWRIFQQHYVPPLSFDEERTIQLAGVEIMRRLIGYAQLPMIWGAHTRVSLLNLARRFVLQPRDTFSQLPFAAVPA